jgi:hypothetical protein
MVPWKKQAKKILTGAWPVRIIHFLNKEMSYFFSWKIFLEA